MNQNFESEVSHVAARDVVIVTMECPHSIACKNRFQRAKIRLLLISSSAWAFFLLTLALAQSV